MKNLIIITNLEAVRNAKNDDSNTGKVCSSLFNGATYQNIIDDASELGLSKIQTQKILSKLKNKVFTLVNQADVDKHQKAMHPPMTDVIKTAVKTTEKPVERKLFKIAEVNPRTGSVKFYVYGALKIGMTKNEIIDAVLALNEGVTKAQIKTCLKNIEYKTGIILFK